MANEAAGQLSSHLAPAERERGTLRQLHRNGLQNAREISKMPIMPHSRLSLMRIRWRTHRKRTHTHTQAGKLGQCLRWAWPASSGPSSKPHCISYIKNCLSWAWAKKTRIVATCSCNMQMKLTEKVALFFPSLRIEAETGIFGCTWMKKANPQQQVEVKEKEKEVNKN